MGTIYSVACKTCEVTRDLDKFYSSYLDTPKNRKEVFLYSENLNSFRAALLVSFMADHQGHDCVFFDEHDDCAIDIDGDYDDNNYSSDTDFWRDKL